MGGQAGAWSVGVRQTNIVWVGFGLGLAILRNVQEEVEKKEKDGEVVRGDIVLAEVQSLGK
jgi:hypothetical protein